MHIICQTTVKRQLPALGRHAQTCIGVCSRACMLSKLAPFLLPLIGRPLHLQEQQSSANVTCYLLGRAGSSIKLCVTHCRWQSFFSRSAAQDRKVTVLQGLYMWGGVGTGKTMLMDLLVKSAPQEFQVCRSCLSCSMQTHFVALLSAILATKMSMFPCTELHQPA